MRNKIIAFDLDDVICSRTSDEGAIQKYHSCQPITEMIDVVNKCYELGAEIIIYTARGMTSYNGNLADIYSNLYELTKKQLDDWGVKHHKLIMGKIHYDLFIDDKAVCSEDIRDFRDIETSAFLDATAE